jgi:carbonic anhydrase
METFSDETMRKLLKYSLKTAAVDKKGWRDVGEGPGSPEDDFIDWLTISDQREAVIEDVQRIRSHPLVPRDIPIFGFIYDVKTGALKEVPEATRLGKAA